MLIYVAYRCVHDTKRYIEMIGMVITHNILGMNAQRQFNIVGSKKKKSTEKLSSGFRINRAADDAAGLTISEKMRSQIRGLNQGIENTQDGVSLCQVADGALHEVNDMLHRITELSVKSANGTNTDADRGAIQKEINQLLSEISRISDTTEFNERKLFVNDSKSTEIQLESDELKEYKRRKAIQSSLKVSGKSQIHEQFQYAIIADESGLSILGDTIPFSEIKNSQGDSVDTTSSLPDVYSFTHNDFVYTFDVPENSNLSDIVTALNGATVTVGDVAWNITPIEYSSIKKTREMSLKATEDGILVSGYGTVSWEDLGIYDLDQAAGKTFSFNDESADLFFEGYFDSEATKEDIINSSSTIVGTRSNMQNWYSLSLPHSSWFGYHGTSIDSVESELSLSYTSGNVKVLGVVDYLTNGTELERLGYNSNLPNLSVNVSVQLISDESGNPIARIIDKNTGNYLDQGLSRKGEIGGGAWFESMDSGNSIGYIVFGDPTGWGGNGCQIKIAVQKPKYMDLNCNTKKFKDYLASIGTVASNITIPSKCYYSITQKGKTVKGYVYPSRITPKTLTPPEEYQEELSNAGISLWIQSGAKEGDGMYLTIDAMNTSILGISDLDVSTVSGALDGIDKVKSALDKVNANRSRIGAQQNRLEHTIANENNIVENTTAAESRIRDTDMAKESANLALQNILTQAGVAMMSQANQSAQGVLQLLQ